MLILCAILLATTCSELLSAQRAVKIDNDFLRVYAFNDDVAILMHEMESVYGKEITELTIDLSSLHFLEYFGVQYETDSKPLNLVTTQFYNTSGRQQNMCELEESSRTYRCEHLSRTLELKGEKTIILKVEIFGYDIKATRFVGCYRSEGLDVSAAETLDHCESDCHGYPFYGFNKEKFCHCIKSLTSLLPINSSLCWNHCPNRKFHLCGTPQTLAVYMGEVKEQVRRNYTTIDCIKSSDCPSCEPGKSGFNCETHVCSSNNGNCGDKKCETMYSSYSVCLCAEGYTFDNNMFCQDYDECDHNSPCAGPNSKCINSVGSYLCKCNVGYSERGGKGCVDIDECMSPTTCEKKSSMCQNLDGSYECLCKAGYAKEPGLTEEDNCKDIDECSNATTCANARCFNLPGKYFCECHEGFRNISTIACADINECERPQICDQNTTTCNNLEGNYECLCKAGYIRKRGESRKISCQDLDECQSILYGCPDGVPCINAPGTYNCICPNGTIRREYIYSVECEDIDECLGLNFCNEENSFCLNILNSYMCLCKSGYDSVDPFTCAKNDGNYSTTTDITLLTTTEQSFDFIVLFVFKVLQLVFGFLLVVILGSGSVYVCYKKVMIFSYPTTPSTESKLRIGKLSALV